MAKDKDKWVKTKTIDVNDNGAVVAQFDNGYSENSKTTDNKATQYQIGRGETFEQYLERTGLSLKPENYDDDALAVIYNKYKKLYPDPSTTPLEDAEKRASNRKKLQLLGDSIALIGQNIANSQGGVVHKYKNDIYDKIDKDKAKADADYRTKLLNNQKLRNEAIMRELNANNDDAKANSAYNRELLKGYLDSEKIKQGEIEVQNKTTNKYGHREDGKVVSTGSGSGKGGGANGDKFQVIPAKDSNGNNIVYEFNIGKHNANALLSAFINEIKNKDPELNLDKVSGGANIRSLINSINAQTDPEAKSQIIANFITNTINDPVYKDVALQVLDEMNASGVYEGILYRRGKERQLPQNANKPNINDAFEEEETEEDYEFQ